MNKKNKQMSIGQLNALTTQTSELFDILEKFNYFISYQIVFINSLDKDVFDIIKNLEEELYYVTKELKNQYKAFT